MVENVRGRSQSAQTQESQEGRRPKAGGHFLGAGQINFPAAVRNAAKAIVPSQGNSGLHVKSFQQTLSAEQKIQTGLPVHRPSIDAPATWMSRKFNAPPGATHGTSNYDRRF